MAILTTALLSTLGGSLLSTVPEILKYFNKKDDQKFQLEKIKLEMAGDASRSKGKIDELNVEADIKEGQSLYAHDASIDGGKYINAFRALIRPLLSILFFAVWAGIKIFVLMNGLNAGVDFVALIPLVWDNDTAAIFGSIMGFWFGGRGIEARYRRKNE